MTDLQQQALNFTCVICLEATFPDADACEAVLYWTEYSHTATIDTDIDIFVSCNWVDRRWQ